MCADICRCARAGDTEWLHERVKKGLPRLPARAQAAILEFVDSRPDFYPLSSWTHVSQLHGPKVGSVFW